MTKKILKMEIDNDVLNEIFLNVRKDLLELGEIKNTIDKRKKEILEKVLSLNFQYELAKSYGHYHIICNDYSAFIWFGETRKDMRTYSGMVNYHLDITKYFNRIKDFDNETFYMDVKIIGTKIYVIFEGVK